MGIGERDIATRGARRSVVGVNFAIHPVGTHTKGKTDMNRVIRHALTGSALGSAMLLMASPAQAACTITTTVLTCTNTTTTNTTYPANVPNDRGYDSPLALTQVNVGAGVLVDGFGLAFNQQANPYTVTNNGAIQVNLGNTPTVGIDGALALWSNVGVANYGGTGTVTSCFARGPDGRGPLVHA